MRVIDCYSAGAVANKPGKTCSRDNNKQPVKTGCSISCLSPRLEMHAFHKRGHSHLFACGLR